MIATVLFFFYEIAHRRPNCHAVCMLCVFCVCRQHKDVALVNLANILHRAHFSADAAILAHAALDHTSDLFTSHYTLGNIYAVSQEKPFRYNSDLNHRLTIWFTA